jgi:hypothetical protein
MTPAVLRAMQSTCTRPFNDGPPMKVENIRVLPLLSNLLTNPSLPACPDGDAATLACYTPWVVGNEVFFVSPPTYTVPLTSIARA